MAFDFPNAPSEGLIHTPSGGPTYKFTAGLWNVQPSPDLTIPGNLTVTGTTTLSGTLGVTGTASLGTATFSGSLTPTITGTLNLGSASLRWATVYTS